MHILGVKFDAPHHPRYSPPKIPPGNPKNRDFPSVYRAFSLKPCFFWLKQKSGVTRLKGKPPKKAGLMFFLFKKQ